MACDRCGYDLPLVEVGDKMFCYSCLKIFDRISNYDFVFNSIPFFRVKHERKKSLYFGIEVEFEARDAVDFEEINDVRKSDAPYFFYAKNDGSLARGFELVSCPFTMKWFIENQHVINDMLADIHPHVEIRRTCGFHIHMSANMFTATHVYRLLRFIYGEDEKISMFSGGRSMDYASFTIPAEGLSLKAMNFIERELPGRHSDRYTAVNTTNSKTIELRFFRGTISPKSVAQFILFADAVYHFTKMTRVKNCNWNRFYAWISKRPEYALVKERIDLLCGQLDDSNTQEDDNSMINSSIVESTSPIEIARNNAELAARLGIENTLLTSNW